MKGSAIRQLAAAVQTPLIAAGHFERRVEIWDANRLTKTAEFDTPLDFGGNRLAMAAKGEIVVAGSYYAPGLAAFAVADGSLLWQRKDLRQIQEVDVSATDSTVAVGFEKGSLQILEIRTGETVEEVRGAKRRVSSPFAEMHVLEKRTFELYSAERPKSLKIARETFAALSICFSKQAVAISEATGAVRCFALHDGSLLWRYPPPGNSHVLKLGYNENERVFLGVERDLESKDGIYPLRTFDEKTGEVLRSFPTEAASDYCFVDRGTRLVSSDGWILDTRAGKLVGAFDFPLKDYR